MDVGHYDPCIFNGDGGNQELLLGMRRHANFIETVPLALVLMALLELNEVPEMAIYGLGALLVAARLTHAFCLKADTIANAGRTIGAAGSALMVLIASVWAIVVFF